MKEQGVEVENQEESTPSKTEELVKLRSQQDIKANEENEKQNDEQEIVKV